MNISSGLTRIIYPGRIAFGSMKGSVEVMTRNMTKELGPRRITVNTVAPGAIQTDFSGRRRARQPGSVPAHRRADRTRPARPSRRYWSDDRVASFGRQSLGERAAHRRVRRPGNLKRVAIFQLRPVRFSVLILRISLSRNRNHFRETCASAKRPFTRQDEERRRIDPWPIRLHKLRRRRAAAQVARYRCLIGLPGVSASAALTMPCASMP